MSIQQRTYSRKKEDVDTHLDVLVLLRFEGERLLVSQSYAHRDRANLDSPIEALQLLSVPLSEALH